jgi:hypothetical protein
VTPPDDICDDPMAWLAVSVPIKGGDVSGTDGRVEA